MGSLFVFIVLQQYFEVVTMPFLIRWPISSPSGVNNSKPLINVL